MSPVAVAGSAPVPLVRSGPRVEVVSDFAALLALKPAWDELLEQANTQHPFLTHEWICTWWECFGTGKELRVLLVRDGAKLVGIAPLMRSETRMYGLGVRRLGTLYNPHVPRCDFIVAAAAQGACRALWRHLRDAERGWDVLELCQLPPGSRALAELPGTARGDGFLTGTWCAPGSPYLRVAGSWDDYFGKLRAKHRSNLRNRLKRLGQLGEVKLDLVSSADELSAPLEDGFRLEAAAWKGEAGTAIGARGDLRLLYTRLAERMARRGRLRLHFLTLDGRRIAFGYSLFHQNRLYLLKPGYDPRYAHLSPSNLLWLMVLRDAFDQGLAEHDFLGMDDAWKLEWTSAVRRHQWLYVFPRSATGALLRSLKFGIVPALRRLAPRRFARNGAS
jgi:CelD/BcsL family acetyltransferase involved in cellulose biosynthesis